MKKSQGKFAVTYRHSAIIILNPEADVARPMWCVNGHDQLVQVTQAGGGSWAISVQRFHSLGIIIFFVPHK